MTRDTLIAASINAMACADDDLTRALDDMREAGENEVAASIRDVRTQLEIVLERTRNLSV